MKLRLALGRDESGRAPLVLQITTKQAPQLASSSGASEGAPTARYRWCAGLGSSGLAVGTAVGVVGWFGPAADPFKGAVGRGMLMLATFGAGAMLSGLVVLAAGPACPDPAEGGRQRRKLWTRGRALPTRSAVRALARSLAHTNEMQMR